MRTDGHGTQILYFGAPDRYRVGWPDSDICIAHRSYSIGTGQLGTTHLYVVVRFGPLNSARPWLLLHMYLFAPPNAGVATNTDTHPHPEILHGQADVGCICGGWPRCSVKHIIAGRGRRLRLVCGTFGGSGLAGGILYPISPKLIRIAPYLPRRED
jgi:hypothetical protein